ncbi:FecCD family ABC transporter permease [Aliirhizobium smilacinae]
MVLSSSDGVTRRTVGSVRIGRIAGLLAGILLLAGLVAASLLFGHRVISMQAALSAIFSYNGSSVDDIIVIYSRLPRTLASVLAGAAFGVAGALIQASTRNPLADPGVLGVNAGSAFFVTLAVGFAGWQSIHAYVWASLVGAFIVSLIVSVFASAGRGGVSNVRLVLTGVGISAVLGGIGSSITLLDPVAFNAMRAWAIGSPAGATMEVVKTISPIILAGLVCSCSIASSLNITALGDDLSRTLGANALHIRIVVIISVTLLAGAGTAAVGPVGFVGLMVPHAVRWLIGADQRWILALTIIYAPILMLGADILGRLVLYPGELEAGILTALIGAPVLILLARRRGARGL